jgi:hypothetical protein
MSITQTAHNVRVWPIVIYKGKILFWYILCFPILPFPYYNYLKKKNQRVEVEDGYHSLKQNVTLSHE